ncbi:hypothetical protein WJX73_003627 [Symbiochloris irregularis]|uniref:CRAL-TRIO domain-containing protein n=1 Tax=Symbiochloris irregularis TaxID=706552 RepID=A0AAW1P2J2_9CHLO
MPLPELEQEKAAVQELKALLKQKNLELPESMVPLGEVDATLYRFLRARRFDIEGACDSLTSTIEWRKENDVEGYLSRSLPDGRDAVIRRCLPSGWIGFDKTGLPVWMEHLAALDIHSMEGAGVTADDFCFYQIRAMEYMANVKLPEATKEYGRLIDTHSIILDLNGLRLGLMTKSTINIFKTVSALYQMHYPEFMTRMFIVNIPMVFGAVWRVAQCFVDERVKAKIRFLRRNELHMLHEFIDAQYLPKELGGHCKDQLISTPTGFIAPSHQHLDREIQKRQQEAADREAEAARQQEEAARQAAAPAAPQSLLQRLSSRVSSSSLGQALRRTSSNIASAAAQPPEHRHSTEAPASSHGHRDSMDTHSVALSKGSKASLPVIPSMAELPVCEDEPVPLMAPLSLPADVADRAEAIGRHAAQVSEARLIRQSLAAQGLGRPSISLPRSITRASIGGSKPSERGDLSQPPKLWTSSIALQHSTSTAHNRSKLARAGSGDEMSAWAELQALRRTESSPDLAAAAEPARPFWGRDAGKAADKAQRREDKERAKAQRRQAREERHAERQAVKAEKAEQKAADREQRRTQRQMSRRASTKSDQGAHLSKTKRLMNCFKPRTTGDAEDASVASATLRESRDYFDADDRSERSRRSSGVSLGTSPDMSLTQSRQGLRSYNSMASGQLTPRSPMSPSSDRDSEDGCRAGGASVAGIRAHLARRVKGVLLPMPRRWCRTVGRH